MTHISRITLKSVVFSILIAWVGLIATPSAHAQATVGAGSIQGTILDPNASVVSSAKVTITSKATGQRQAPKVTESGEYNSGSLTPGEYVIRVEASGFKTVEKKVVVQVGLVTPGTVTLEIGASSTVITVEATSGQVDTEQAIVSGVLTTQQIENLPINGRNFLDLAQLEPGVQIQDGANFDPTKTGFSSISFGGRFGRTARIEVDGVDISDETVGTTTSNIPASALQEFQLSQSSLDLSNELTSSGSVNVTTRSGTNDYHGQAFGLFRDSSMAAALPGGYTPFQRSQFGGNFGGPVLKNKVFFFMDGERTKQELFNRVILPAPLVSPVAGYSTPYRESDLLAKVDYNATPNLKIFSRFTYFANSAVSPSSFSPFDNKDITRTFLVGGDWTKGSWTHSFRFEYLKFHNQIVDATAPLHLPFSDLGVYIFFGATGVSFGPNLLAPQETPQSDHQYKYDGSKSLRNHIVRYGFSVNHIEGGGYAKFFALGPRVVNFQDNATTAFFAAHPGLDQSNPANYPVETSTLGNGLGFSTEKPSFGFPAGGLGPDNRLGLYIGDSWKIKQNLTLSAGVRYVRDSGRTDSDLPALDAVNQIFPGVGNRVRQPNLNFAPQIGIAWDPFKSGKTVIRAGGGFYYENVIFNNVLFDRPFRLAKGAFLANPRACNGLDTPAQVPFADGTTPTPPAGSCGNGQGGGVTIQSAAPLLAQFQKTYQANTLANGGLSAPNKGGYLPTLLQNGSLITPPTGFFDPNYQTPRALQMNIGLQRELWKGGVLSADYLRNIGTHLLVGQDINHVGDTRFFNLAAAQDAVARTLVACGGGLTLAQAMAACPGIHPAANGNPAGGVTLTDFAANGLGVPGDVGVGVCTVKFKNGCAFPGVNPSGPSFYLQKSIGRSTYDALQVKLVQNLTNPVKGIRSSNFQISYSLSKYENMGGFTGASPFASAPTASDLDFVVGALDNRDPFKYFGPGALDRKHQLSFGGTADLLGGFRAGIVAHFYSALPNTLFSNPSTNPGEIFRTYFTGDGSFGDPLPGTHLGTFGRDVSLGGLNGALGSFNSKFAGQATPAGQVLIQNGLFTLAQLQAMGDGVIPAIPLAPKDQVGMYGLRAFDMKLSWTHRFAERVSVEPGVSFFNLFNFANFDLPTPAGGLLSGTLNGNVGTLNGTNYTNQNSLRVGAGTGVFALGAPRVIEWSLKITF